LCRLNIWCDGSFSGGVIGGGGRRLRSIVLASHDQSPFRKSVRGKILTLKPLESDERYAAAMSPDGPDATGRQDEHLDNVAGMVGLDSEVSAAEYAVVVD
jgi:hypothetical protein